MGDIIIYLAGDLIGTLQDFDWVHFWLNQMEW